MNIYIPIEVKVRELEGRGLLALAAAERGHTVVFGGKEDTLKMARSGRFPPGIVYLKSITPSETKISLLRDLNKQGHRVTVQDEESGLLDDSYERFARLRFSSEVLSLVSRVFTWGEFDAGSLKEIYGQYSGKFVKTGSPRVDFWRKDFSDFYRNHPAATIGKSGPLILVSSNFSSLLNENRYWNVIAKLRESGYFNRDTNWEFFEYENAAYQIRLIGEFVKMVRALSDSFPKATILVRPHPVESVEGWKKLIGDYPNIVVQREGTISGWIRHAVVNIHNGCTSALEAAVGGTPRIAYRPLPNKIEREIPNRMSSHAFTLEELIQSVEATIEGRPLQDSEEVAERTFGLLNPRFANLEGRLAADRILDEWESIGREAGLEQSSVEELFRCKVEEKTPVSKRFKRHLVRVRNAVIGPPEVKSQNNKLLKSNHKFPDFRDRDLETLTANLEQVLDRFHNVAFKRFGPRSFVLYSE